MYGMGRLGILTMLFWAVLMPEAAARAAADSATPVYRYRVVHAYPHDRGAFTQGLVFHDGVLYEGTGLNGASSLRRVELKTGRVLQVRELPAALFGEGVTVWGDRLIQLTYRNRLLLVYDRRDFTLQKTLPYPVEGWGLTHDGKRLIASDGSATLRFLDPVTFAETGRVGVFDEQGPVTRLNELEYVGGEVFANVWKTDRIARINPRTGRVTGWIDLTGLLGPAERRGRIDVLNGIAWDRQTGRLFVTGKWWPKLFEIELVPAVPPRPR